MALIARLYVNDTEIGWIAAMRTERGRNGGLPEPDEVHVYEIESVVDGVSRHGKVSHRYGDGAAALIAKAAQEVSS